MSKAKAPPGLMVKKRPNAKSNSISESEGSDYAISSSPASFESQHRTFSFSSLKKGRTWQSFGNKDHDPANDAAGSSRHRTRRLSKSRPLSSSSHIDPLGRWGSAVPGDPNRLSLSADSLSVVNAASSPSVGWDAQHVEGYAPLEPDTHLLKTKSPYLVVTSDYLCKMRSRADALALLSASSVDAGKHEAKGSAPDPLLVIPQDAIVSVFAAESTRPSFGFEVWWRNPLAGHSFCRSDFFFGNPTDRNEQLHHIIRAMRAHQQDESGLSRHSQDIRVLLEKVHEAEEPRFLHRKPDIFPVVPRGNTRKEHLPKLEDATKKPQEGPAFYLVVGTYLCHLVEVQKGKGGEPTCRHKTYGLVTLESFKAEWILHEERFNITFREPFKVPVTLELASRYYRQIIRVFGTADRFLKPAWPQLWQSMEIFHVSGLKEQQYLVPKEDYGSFKRTLDAYLAAYSCEAVDWQINWKARFPPEFRLLPPERGSYTPLQLLAVLRALRYNDYFNSLSFKDVDLSALYGLEDNTFRKVNVAYLSRTCVALGSDEIEMLRISPVLHQEFHALAFCSETIRQIDFTNCTRLLSSRLAQGKAGPVPSLQFLTPILNLLRSGITKCNRLILSGNLLPESDIVDLAEIMKTDAIQALDVSCCGLDDSSLRDMIVLPLSERPGQLQSLSVSGNPGRLPGHTLPRLLRYLTDIRVLNLSGSIQPDSYTEGSRLPYATLEKMEMLEELNISGYKIDEATFSDLEQFLQYRSWRLDQDRPLPFSRLVLNHCGITGSQAARLFHSIGEDRGMHLSLSGNPIEDGIEALADAIRQQKGPSGLRIDMIEFKLESNYLCLIRALTETRYLTNLSLAGTAPSPSSPGPCSEELVATLHDFFARNTSVTRLDLSGFSGKLDDGQLPAGFGRALAGLASNATLTHLRIRNQNLHGDAGALGRALARNASLRSVDCRDNGFNLTSLRFLADSLAANPAPTVIDFPLARDPAERAAAWRAVLRGLQRTPSSAALYPPPAPGTVSAAANPSPAAAAAAAARNLLREEEALLREVLDKTFAALEGTVARNRERYEAEAREAGAMSGADLQPPRSTYRGGSQQPSHRRWGSDDSELGAVGTDLAAGVSPGSEGGWAAGFDFGVGDSLHPHDGAGDTGRSPSTATTDSDPDPEPGTAAGSPLLQMPVPVPVPMPMQMQMQIRARSAPDDAGAVAGGTESPAETLDPVSEVDTPAEEPGREQHRVRIVVDGEEAVMGRLSGEEEEGDAVFRKMVDDFKAAGFEV